MFLYGWLLFLGIMTAGVSQSEIISKLDPKELLKIYRKNDIETLAETVRSINEAQEYSRQIQQENQVPQEKNTQQIQTILSQQTGRAR